MTGRLHPFVFVLMQSGDATEVTFYAPDATTARAYVEEWATARGWVIEEPS